MRCPGWVRRAPIPADTPAGNHVFPYPARVAHDTGGLGNDCFRHPDSSRPWSAGGGEVGDLDALAALWRWDSLVDSVVHEAASSGASSVETGWVCRITGFFGM